MGNPTRPAQINELLGDTLTGVAVSPDKTEITFHSQYGTYRMFHDQECCEEVEVEDICGNIEDIVGTPILMAEAVYKAPTIEDSRTWTFYKLATVKGAVTFRWWGDGNGSYSEAVEAKRGFIRTSKAWYADAEVMFGMYFDRYDCMGEMAMRWVDLGHGIMVPRLECFGDAFHVLEAFHDVITKMANDPDFTEPEFVQMLLDCGFEDLTQYKTEAN